VGKDHPTGSQPAGMLPQVATSRWNRILRWWV
jgi:hypothetical protein